MQVSKILRSVEGGRLMFKCPGCDKPHMIRVGDGTGPGWTYNGNPEAPTFTPSVLVRSGHYAAGFKGGECWCTWENEDGERSGFSCYICHSFVTDGQIQFLTDSTHALAGQTVSLPPFDGD